MWFAMVGKKKSLALFLIVGLPSKAEVMLMYDDVLVTSQFLVSC